MGNWRYIVFICLYWLICFNGMAQETQSNWTMEVKGMVTENDKRLPGAVITIIDGGNVVNTINSSDGKFNFQLQADKDYTITFSKPGYITKRISFSTKNVPSDRGKYGFSVFTIDQVDIFPEMEGTDIDQILQQPVAKINYNSKYHSGDFDFDERYTQSIQTMLDKIVAAKKALEAQYKKLIAKADAEFGKQTYNEAKNDYTAALKLKSNEQYPKDQLAAIEKALAEQKKQEEKNAEKTAAQRAVQARYDSVVRLADAAYTAADYNKAKGLYTEALHIIPDKKYPKDQLDAIEKALTSKDKADKQKGVQAQYDSIIKLADAAFQKKDYNSAKSIYNQALQVIPGRKYPKDQLDLIDKTVASNEKSAKQKSIDTQYDSIIKQADAAFQKKEYNSAKDKYNSALQIKPSKPYPKQQIAAIDKLIATNEKSAKQKNIDGQYDSIVKLADASFHKKDYTTAKIEYNGALQLKPTKAYPKQQIAAIDKILDASQKTAKQKGADAQYDSVIKTANEALHKKDYTNARAEYSSAAEMKPEKPYPKQQIALIDRILALHKKPVNKDSLVKAKKPKVDTVKAAPTVHIQVSPCNIKAQSDSCRRYLRPFLYDGVNALHLPLKKEAQEKEISFPAFSGQRYRFIINLSSMPQGTTVIIYDEDNTHKKRKSLYSAGDAAHRISTFDSDSKSDRFFIDYEIPPNNGPPAEGCAVIMFGYETKK